MTRKITRKGAVRKADKAFSEYIRARDKRCVLCNTRERLQCGHIFSRVAYSTRWEEDNAYCQCAGCNLRHEHDPYLFFNYVIGLKGKRFLDDLHIRWKQINKLKTFEIIEIADKYTDKLSQLSLLDSRP